MYQIQARSLGEEAFRALTTPNFLGKVHSVFRHAINILQREQKILTVLSIPERASWIATVTEDTKFNDLGIARGQEVRLQEARIIVGSGLVVDLQDAQLWRTPDWTCKHAEPKEEEILRRLHEVRIILSVMGTKGGLGNILFDTAGPSVSSSNVFTSKAKPRIAALSDAIIHGRVDLIRENSRTLAGLGIGSTPSGDDFLAGLMVGFRYGTQHLRGDENYEAEVCEAILASATGRTNLISQSHLEYASQGTTNESTFEFICSLLGHEGELASRTVAVLRKGATSGEDTIVGIVHGVMAALTKRRFSSR